MIDVAEIESISEGIDAVFEAAIGNTKPLFSRLTSDATLHYLEREALAHLVSGELIPFKGGRGEKLPDYLLSLDDLQERHALHAATAHYRLIMLRLRESGNVYRASETALEYVAGKYELDTVSSPT